MHLVIMNMYSIIVYFSTEYEVKTAERLRKFWKYNRYLEFLSCVHFFTQGDTL